MNLLTLILGIVLAVISVNLYRYNFDEVGEWKNKTFVGAASYVIVTAGAFLLTVGSFHTLIS